MLRFCTPSAAFVCIYSFCLLPIYIRTVQPSRFFTIPKAKQAVSHDLPWETACFFCSKQTVGRLLRLLRSLRRSAEGLDRLCGLLPLLLQRLLQDHILHLSKTLVQISTNSSKMTLFGRRVVTINLVERWLIHPNPGPVMSPLCQFNHPFLHLFPDYLRSDMLRFPVGKIIIYHLIFDVKSFNLLSFSEQFLCFTSENSFCSLLMTIDAFPLLHHLYSYF